MAIVLIYDATRVTETMATTRATALGIGQVVRGVPPWVAQLLPGAPDALLASAEGYASVVESDAQPHQLLGAVARGDLSATALATRFPETFTPPAPPPDFVTLRQAIVDAATLPLLKTALLAFLDQVRRN